MNRGLSLGDGNIHQLSNYELSDSDDTTYTVPKQQTAPRKMPVKSHIVVEFRQTCTPYQHQLLTADLKKKRKKNSVSKCPKCGKEIYAW